MAFDLVVEFAGLCVYVVQPDGKRVAILLPDTRLTTSDPVHADGTTGQPHVGYVRFALPNLRDDVPAGDLRAPSNEIVHQLDREVIDWGLDDQDMQEVSLVLPDASKFAPSLTLANDLFSATPPTELLARTLLPGGSLRAVPGNATWVFSRQFAPALPNHTGNFAGFATWTRNVPDRDDMTITIRRLDGSGSISLPLKPRNGLIALKVANLCANNPLEWNDLKKHRVQESDEDFKWAYRLLEPKAQYATLLAGSTFPVPTLAGPMRPAGDEDCVGLTITAPIPG